jgi:hypothetical protein
MLEVISIIFGFAPGRKLASLCYGVLALQPFSSSFWNEAFALEQRLILVYFWAMALRLIAERREDAACIVL